MTIRSASILFVLFLFNFIVSTQEVLAQEESAAKEQDNVMSPKRYPLYEYRDRSHTYQESAEHVGIIYGVSWILYPATQPDVVKNQGSWTKYRKNFGQVVFDRDEPFWNWFVHPISGSQLFLLYRGLGYSRISSLTMTFISSTLFEFTIEIYTEPASVQDLYQTPVLGSIMGVGLETLSLYLLNTGYTFAKVFGHILNPTTLFEFNEARRLSIVPYFDGKKTGVGMAMEF